MSLWFVNVAGPSFSQRDGFCVEKFCSNQYRFIVGLCVWWAAAISGLSSPKMSSLMCCMWTDRRAEQWKGSLECLGFPCWDGSSRGWRPMWGQLLHVVQPLIIHQRFKYEEHVIVIFTFVYFLDWSCYRNGHEFDWPQRVYGGNGMLDAYFVLSSEYNIWWPPFHFPNQVSSEVLWPGKWNWAREWGSSWRNFSQCSPKGVWMT